MAFSVYFHVAISCVLLGWFSLIFGGFPVVQGRRRGFQEEGRRERWCELVWLTLGGVGGQFPRRAFPFRPHWNCTDIALHSKTAWKLLWNCTKVALKLLWIRKLIWNCSEIALKLLWNCSEFENCSKIALKLLWNCSEIALNSRTALKLLWIRKLIWNCTEVALKLLWIRKLL